MKFDLDKSYLKKINIGNPLSLNRKFNIIQQYFEDIASGNIYTISKQFLNKIFKNYGYENLKTAQTLFRYDNRNVLNEIDFTEKINNEVFSIYSFNNYLVYVKDVYADKYINLLDFLKTMPFTVSINMFDDKNPINQFCIEILLEDTFEVDVFIDFIYEKIEVYLLDYIYKDNIITNISHVDTFSFDEFSVFNIDQIIQKVLNTENYKFNIDTRLDFKDIQKLKNSLQKKLFKASKKLFDDLNYSKNMVSFNTSYLDDTYLVHSETGKPYQISELYNLITKVKNTLSAEDMSQLSKLF